MLVIPTSYQKVISGNRGCPRSHYSSLEYSGYDTSQLWHIPLLLSGCLFPFGHTPHSVFISFYYFFYYVSLIFKQSGNPLQHWLNRISKTRLMCCNLGKKKTGQKEMGWEVALLLKLATHGPQSEEHTLIGSPSSLAPHTALTWDSTNAGTELTQDSQSQHCPLSTFTSCSAPFL
jgi:hypothetical protein